MDNRKQGWNPAGHQRESSDFLAGTLRPADNKIPAERLSLISVFNQRSSAGK
ncbi:MAG TPA: hypothetical protein VKR53_09580 [Puia sp.]|nr:hypothetical protein [Puia sp.]